jgi:hypothetical protein
MFTYQVLLAVIKWLWQWHLGDSTGKKTGWGVGGVHYSCSTKWFLKAYMQGKKSRHKPSVSLQAHYTGETIFHTEFWQYE